MKGKPKLTKGQATKSVRRILLKYQIDLNHLQFSANASSIYFSGQMLKNSGNDIPAQEMLVIVQELAALGTIKSDLQNWFLSNDQIYYLGNEDTEEAAQ